MRAESFRQWSTVEGGVTYVRAVDLWLTSFSHTKTGANYVRVLNDLVEWSVLTFGRPVLPDELSVEDARLFVSQMNESRFGLTAKRLACNSAEQLESEMFEFVARTGSCDLRAIRDGVRLAAGLTDPELDRRLGGLCSRNYLRRSPTIRELRSGQVHLGGKADNRVPIDFRLDPKLFRYTVSAAVGAGSGLRSATVRLSALSSLWKFMHELMLTNIWGGLVSEVKTEAGPARRRQPMTIETFSRLLGTTFDWSGGNVKASDALIDVRDRALLLFLLHTGARDIEVVKVAQSDVAWSSGVSVRFVKNTKSRVVGLAPRVCDALKALNEKLARLGRTPDARSPLFPSMSGWGANACRVGSWLSPRSIAKTLKRRAEQAGIDDASSINVTALRRLAVSIAVDAGTPLSVVAGLMGSSEVAVDVPPTDGVLLFDWQPSRRGPLPNMDPVRRGGPPVSNNNFSWSDVLGARAR